MKDFSMDPWQFKRLTRLDRKILHYTRVMDQHFQAEEMERHKKEMEMEANRQKLMGKMPRLRR